jgi:hypothetical protein
MKYIVNSYFQLILIYSINTPIELLLIPLTYLFLIFSFIINKGISEIKHLIYFENLSKFLIKKTKRNLLFFLKKRTGGSIKQQNLG